MKTTKKILSVILTLAMLLTSFVFVFPAAAEEVAFGGTGTQADPYTIGTVAQLKLLRDNVNGGNNYSGKYFKLTADIDLTEGGTVSTWTPIGNSKSGGTSSRFSGTLDGNGKTITMKQTLNTPKAAGYCGLFGYISDNASVKNLTLDATIDFNIGWFTASTPAKVKSGDAYSTYIGGVFAAGIQGNSVIDGVTVKLNNSKILTGYASWVGGIVGVMGGQTTDNPTIQNCTVTGDLTVEVTTYTNAGVAAVGGIAAAVTEQGSILNCKNEANISLVKKSGQFAQLGGIIGVTGYLASNSTNIFKIINCVNTGTLSSSGGNQARVGGIVADHGYCGHCGLLIEQCGSYGALISETDGTIAGGLGLFAAYCQDYADPLLINQCYFNQTALNQSKRSEKDSTEGTNYAPGIFLSNTATTAASHKNVHVYTVVSVGTNEVDTTLNTNNYWDDFAATALTSAADYDAANSTSYADTYDYVITSAADLALMAKLCNETGGTVATYCAAKYVLVNDIDLSAHQWTPIAVQHNSYGTRGTEGNYTKYFTGTFDGNGHTISGLTMTNEAYTYGQSLFGVINTGAVIQNFTLDGARVDKASQATNTKASINGGIGLIANIAYAGTISNVNVTNMNVNADLLASNTGGYIGGFVAYSGNATVNIVDCTASGSINVRTDKTAFVGGIVASINGVNINRCTSNVNITFKTTIDPYSYVGGIVGVVDTTTDGRQNNISNSIYEGALTLADGSTGALGLAGILGGTSANTGYTVTITNCASIQTYTGEKLGNLGGIVGANRNTASGDKKTSIISCYTNSAKLGTNLNITDSNLTITNSVAGTFDLETLKGAAIRLDETKANSGIRFDSNVNETTIAALKTAGFNVEVGTVIAPTENFKHFGGDVAALVDNNAENSFLKVVYNQDFIDVAGANFTGALKTIKSENYERDFNGVGYVKITAGDLTYTVYANFDAANARSVKTIANMAYNDRAEKLNGTTTYGHKGSHLVAGEGTYSPYNADELAILATYAGIQ